MNWTPASSFGPREHRESTDLSPSYPEDSDLAEKDSSRESVRLPSCPSTPLSPFFSIFAHHLRKDRRDAGARSRGRKWGILCTVLVQYKSFSCNTYGPPRKCCKQKTYGLAKSFRCNIYKIPGGGCTRLTS